MVKLLPMKKVINNITQPLNQLIRNAFAKADTRRYFYSDCVWNANSRGYDATSNVNRTYTIPINGYYTIRAYSGWHGSYGKISGKFQKGEVIAMNFTKTYTVYGWQATGVNITSAQKEEGEFRLSVNKDAIVTGTSDTFVLALGIGGGGNSKDGGYANVSCNNGIAIGGGGGSNFVSSYPADGIRGYNGGNAYAKGVNVYAIGGGAGAGTGTNKALGGCAIVNDNIVTTSYNEARMSNEIYSCKGNSTASSGAGGNGGCGGAGFMYEALGITLNASCGYGMWGDGGNVVGGGAKGGSGAIGSNGTMLVCGRRGYFGGGAGTTLTNGGVGGFYGGSGANGGIGTYGFGGNGNHGGDGQLIGGSGNYGGNGLKAGTGTISNGTAIRHKSIVHTVPAWNKTANDSMVIIEYGISEDNY